MKRRLAIALGLLAAFALTFAAVPEAPAVDTAQSLTRIVSIGGSVTEIVHALGFSDAIVAVDTTSVFPETAAALPKIGYMRQLAAEPILALAPTLILAEADSGPPAVLDQLREAGARIVLVPDDPTPQGVVAKIAAVGAALGVPERAQALAGSIGDDLDRTAAAIARLPARPRVLFLLSIGSGGAPMAAGRGTSAGGMIALAGGANAIDAFEGYKPLSAEAAVAAAPEIVLITERSLALLGGVDAVAAIPEISATPAGRARRIVAMDGLLMLGFGPRTPAAAMMLAARFHPDALLATGRP